jgi:ubiquinone/menaquinone biosynthesis C-methylase UbiE
MTGASKSFKDLEHAGWSGNAGDYDALAGSITSQAAQHLLDATGVKHGTKLLEVACGPGYCSVAAAERGAQTIGIDFARPMVEEAARRHPKLDFREGDAEALSFDNECLDAVVCPFGLLHLERPERAISEALRVLRPAGKYGFSVWCSPDKFQYIALVLKAVQAHADMDVDLPPAPDFFRFSDHDECRAVLLEAGFTDPEVREVDLIWHPSSEEDFVDMIYKSTVRTRMVIERQSEEIRERINQDIRDSAADFRNGDVYEVVWPAVIASALRP